MANKRFWIVATSFVAGALGLYASHTYEQNQAYQTGVYIGKAALTAEDLKNRRCLSLNADSLQRGCEIHDLNKDSIMEEAFASANILPSLRDSKAIRTGFRDGWQGARK